MTRIITITSGSLQAGKTQLAINLALELVRRGRQTGVFQDADAARALDSQLDMQHSAVPHRRATDLPAGDIVRRGYQGVDFMTCRLRLDAWADSDAERLRACIHDMDTHDGYDELLIDTSGMEPAAILGCCLAADVVVVVVTPDARSQAGAFALLRILRLNGFDGTPRLLVNRLHGTQQAADTCDRLNIQVREHLGLDVPLLGALAEDDHVMAAQRTRQAFSSVYPDSDAAAAVVTVADALDAITGRAAPGRQTVTRFWKTFLEKVRMPLQLPGKLTLAEVPGQAGHGAVPGEEEEAAAETGLVQFDGSLALLCDTLVTLPETLGVLAHDMSELVAALASAQTLRPLAAGDVCTERECLQLAAAILNGVCESATQREHVHLQVTECRIEADTDNWLQGGDYMRFAFRVGTQGGLMERLQAVFARLRLPLRAQEQDTEVLWERMNPARSVSLGVSVTLPDELRLVLWVPARQESAAAAHSPAAAAKKH
jgi:MinD-like ATPase involved in chromosome partitioning or flagellar assembly